MKVSSQSIHNVQSQQNIQSPPIKANNSSIASSTSNVSNTSNQQPKIVTAEKTVHVKDVKQLNTKIKNSIKKIVSQLKTAQSGDVFSRNGVNMKDISTTLSSLKNEIKSYQTKLDSSSYKHHTSKKETITKLNNLVKSTEGKIHLAESKLQFERRQNNTIGLDSQEKINERITQEASRSKYE